MMGGNETDQIHLKWLEAAIDEAKKVEFKNILTSYFLFDWTYQLKQSDSRFVPTLYKNHVQ